MKVQYCQTANSRQRWHGERSTAESWEVLFRAIVQHLYPLELSCDRPVEERGVTLHAQAPELQPRRSAAVARQQIAAIAQEESQED